LSDFLKDLSTLGSSISNAVNSVSNLIDGAAILAAPRQKETDWEFTIERKSLISGNNSEVRNLADNLFNSAKNIGLNAIGMDTGNSELPDLKYRVRSVSFPQLTLETQKTRWGTNPFIGFNHPELVNVVIEEDIFFRTLGYFNEWMFQVFDPINNVFKSHDDSSHIYRQGILTFGKPIPLLGVTGLTLKMSNLKYLGVEPITVVYDGEDCLMYTLTFAVESILPVGLSLNPTFSAAFASYGTIASLINTIS